MVGMRLFEGKWSIHLGLMSAILVLFVLIVGVGWGAGEVVANSNCTYTVWDDNQLKEANISVSPGEVVGLLGPNGAGKTTTFHMIVGIIKPTSGEVFLGDENITDLPMYMRARRGISYLSQEPSVFRKLTVEDNLMAILETQDEKGYHGFIISTQKRKQKRKHEKAISALAHSGFIFNNRLW